MIQKLIEQYLSSGGKEPYAVLFAPGVYADVPVGVFMAWTPVLVNRVVVLPLNAAAALLIDARQAVVKEPETKETEDHA